VSRHRTENEGENFPGGESSFTKRDRRIYNMYAQLFSFYVACRNSMTYACLQGSVCISLQVCDALCVPSRDTCDGKGAKQFNEKRRDEQATSMGSLGSTT